MSLDDGEGCVQCHPVDQVRQLAQASPDPWDDVTILEDHALDVAPSASGSSDPSPEGERLSWAEDHSVQRSRGNLEVFYLVPLHPHRVIGERTDQGCSVFKHRVPQRIPPHVSPIAAAQVPLEISSDGIVESPGEESVFRAPGGSWHV